ncbi:winged helix-turn-helix domain-containing protein [Haloferax volcanii]|uniref:winged helix-turn-helix domain-containing protein n=1 Tax=Haloferax volcanii TaxID=2246 RepID=UPI00385A70C0
MNIEDVCSALSNPTRRRLMSVVIASGPMSSKQAHEIYQQKFETYRRESIYKSLETLVSANLLEKTYDEDDGLRYSARMTQLQLNLEGMEVESVAE